MIATALSTFFGVGYARVAPGTVASAVALPIAWLILWKLGPTALMMASLGIYLIGVWSCDVYAKRTGGVDPSECVIDEVAGQLVSLSFVPHSILLYGAAFLLFRLFDIVKPFPVRQSESLPHGFGIMTDDMLAGLYALAVLQMAILLLK
jgi:phosphatidylglycerophosphatase A